MVNRDRLVKEFIKMVSIDSETGSESMLREYIRDKLAALGISAETDGAGNLYGCLEGNRKGDPILFSSHLDTVSPGKGKRAIVHGDGKITSDGTTVLGADDAAGLAAILEALTVIYEKNLPHADIELLFPVAEEAYCEGTARFDFSRLKAKTAYVLDLTGRVGAAATAAPTILSLDIRVKGKAAHAGFSPEEGINALSIAVSALSALNTGHISPDTTVNFGTIGGGSGKNIVPEEIAIGGEIRSMRHEEAIKQAEIIRAAFTKSADLYGGRAEVSVTEKIRAYAIDEGEEVIGRFRRALNELHFGGPELVSTFGGSDNNNFNRHGIKGIVLACAMNNVHSVNEYTEIPELERSAELTLRLMTSED